MPVEEGTPVVAKVDEPVVVTVAVEPPAVTSPAFNDLDAANAEVKRLRAESGTRRVSNVELTRQIDDLKKQVPTSDVQAQITALQSQVNRFQAAGEAGVSPELLRAGEELNAATTPEEMKAATEKIARLTAAPPTLRNPTPPTQPTQPASRDQQIEAAEKGHNVREAVRLKTEKLLDQP